MSSNMIPDEEIDDEQDWVQQREVANGKVRITIEGSTSDSYVLESLARLMLGSATEGGDQFFRRLKEWQANTDQRGNAIYSESPDESDQERLRYALIGLLAQAPGTAHAFLSSAVQVSDSAYAFVSHLASPVTNSRLGRPFQRRYNNMAARGGSIVERWIDVGRATEQRSRALARQAAFDGTDEAMDEMIGLLAVKPEVRDLVTAQSIGMASTLMGILRERAAASDTRWERRLRRLFRRR